MKLLLFILGISLCAALPSFRNLQEAVINPEVTDPVVEEIDEVPIQATEPATEEADEAPIQATEPATEEVAEGPIQVIEPATEEVDEVPIQMESDFQFVNEDDGVAGWLFDGVISTEEAGFWQSPESEELFPVETDAQEFFPEEETEESLLEQIREDYYLNDMFEYGLNAVVSAGIQKAKIPNVNFTASEISEYSMATSDNGDYVSFTCQAVSQNRSSAINMTFTVYYSYREEQIILSTYTYVIRTSTPAANPTNPTNPTNSTNSTNSTNPTNLTNTTNPATDIYVELTPAQIGTSEEVQDVVAFGNAQLIKKGNENGKIPVSVYDLTNITSVARMRSSGKTYYKCNVELKDAIGVKISAQYVVSLTVGTGAMFFNSWSYNVTNIKFSIDNSTFTEVNKTEAQNNTQIALCLDYAITHVVKEPEQYIKIDINSVSSQVVKGVVLYKFDVKLDNNNGKTVNLIATVSYKPETGAMAVKSSEARTTTVTIKRK